MTESKEDGLLPCPFCGAHLQRQQTPSGHWHEHMGEVEDCYATGSIVFDENIAAWNRRASSPPVGGLARFNPMYNGIEDGFGTVTMVESAAGQWVRYSDVTSPPVGGSGEVVADALARAQETLNNAKVTGENPTSQRALEYRLGELINLLVAPVPNGVPEGAEWRGAGIPFECPYPSVGAVGAPNAYQIDPGAGSAMDRVQRDWPAPSMVENLRLRDGRVTPLYAASPVTPEGLSGGDAK